MWNLRKIKEITSIVMSVLLDQDLHLEPIETAEIIDQRESLQVGDNFDNFVQHSTKVILNGKWALSALAQRIQPGCGLYLSGRQSCTKRYRLSGKMRHSK